MAEHDGIIDLTDEVGQTETDDESIIELIDPVPAEDDVLELTDVLEADETAAPVIDLTDELPETVAAEAVIDLVDEAMIEEPTDTPVEQPAPANPTPPSPEIEKAPPESELGDVIYFDDEMEEELDTTQEDDFVESLGMAIEDSGSPENEEEDFEAQAMAAEIGHPAPPPAPAETAPVSPTQTETAAAPPSAIPEDLMTAAIEKAVAARIDAILFQVVEKAVTREIEKIKKAILDEMAE